MANIVDSCSCTPDPFFALGDASHHRYLFPNFRFIVHSAPSPPISLTIFFFFRLRFIYIIIHCFSRGNACYVGRRLSKLIELIQLSLLLNRMLYLLTLGFPVYGVGNKAATQAQARTRYSDSGPGSNPIQILTNAPYILIDSEEYYGYIVK